MPKLTFKSRLSLWFTTILSLSLLVTGIVFAIAYFGVSLVNRQNFMIREANEVSEKHLVNKDGEIFFKKDDQGNTLSSYLRDEGLSAIVIDKQDQIIGAYGVYNGLLSNRDRESLVKKSEIEKTLLFNKQRFGLYNLYEGRTYLTLLYPVNIDGEIIGTLVLGSDMDYGRQMLVFSLILLALILPISILFGWVATHSMIGKSFRPLEDILNKMKNVEVGKLSEKIYIKGNSKDELVRLSKSYNEMISRLGDGIKKQREFIANTSHELKTPLTQSILALEIVEMDLNSKNIKKASEGILKVQDNLKKYGELINSLLELARVKEDEVVWNKLNVNETISSILDDYAVTAKNNKLTMNTEIEKNLIFNFSEDHFKIILTNLLSNAIKYSERNSVVKIAIKKDKQNGVLIVENQTKAINRSDLSKIWKRFHRVKNKSDHNGYGIGLSVVREISLMNKLKIDNRMTKDNHFVVEISGFELI